jgi:hypothetical protein
LLKVRRKTKPEEVEQWQVDHMKVGVLLSVGNAMRQATPEQCEVACPDPDTVSGHFVVDGSAGGRS